VWSVVELGCMGAVSRVRWLGVVGLGVVWGSCPGMRVRWIDLMSFVSPLVGRYAAHRWVVVW
jgi:hypothetical protein